MAYQTVAITMTLSDLEGHSLTAGLFKCEFLCNCAAADMNSADIVRRAVPL